MHLTETFLQCQCVIWLMMDRGNLRESKPTKSSNQTEERDHDRTVKPVCVILRSRNGFKNSANIWWMMKFHYREALTQVLLMSRLQSDVRIWVNTVFILISLKTEIARSVNGPNLQGLRAEDAMAKPYLVL